MSKDRVIRSPMFYVGDKYKLIPDIMRFFPRKIDKFYEPFVGGGTVSLNVKAKEYILNDVDNCVYRIHNFLASMAKEDDFFDSVLEFAIKYNLSRSFYEDVVPKKMKSEYKKTYYAKYNKEGYNLMKDAFNSDPKNNSMLLYLLLIYGFNRMLRFNSKGEFNVPVGNVDFNKNVKKAVIDYFHFVRNNEIKYKNLDFKIFLEKQIFKTDDFIYFDPPYLIASSEYNKIWNEDKERDLISLLDELNDRNIRFAISNVTTYKGKENVIFSKWMGKYNIADINSNYISYHDNSNKVFKEVLVYNY